MAKSKALRFFALQRCPRESSPGGASELSPALHSLQKNSDSDEFWEGHDFTGCGKTLVLDFALKGRGFSRAVSVAKSMAALAAEGSRDPQCDFFRSLFSRAVKSLKMCPRFSA